MHHIGCYFHFTQAIYRQIQHLHLTTIYRDDETARSTARKLMSLPLVPLDYVQDAFDIISAEAPDSMIPLVDYFDGYWITKVKWSLWNVSDVSLRTNNMVEGCFLIISSQYSFSSFFCSIGWSHRFNRLVAKFHPNIWHFIDCLKKEEVCVRQQMLKTTMGEKKQTNKKAAAVQEQIHSLQSQFEKNEINVYGLLQGLSLLIGAQS